MKREDLDKFFDSEFGGGKISIPWSAGNYTYASNGHVLIRIPRMKGVKERKDAPKIEGSKLGDVFNTEPEKWYPIPPVSMPEPSICVYCDGTGKDGMDRRKKCFECDGSGKVLNHGSVKISEVLFSDVYLCMINELGNAEIGPFGPADPARFRFKDGEGLIMPRKS